MRELKPTGLVLVGFLIICFLFALAQAEPHHGASASLDKLREFQSDPVGHGQVSGGGQLKLAKGTIDIPWATHHLFGSKPFLPDHTPVATITSESLNADRSPDCSRGIAGLQKLSALNAAKQRNLTRGESQGGDPGQEKSNSLNILAHFLKMRENAKTDQNSQSRALIESGNYLSVDVHGIRVQAINTVEGGNAVATSNIVIKPVQTVIYAPEVQERLK